MTPANIDAEANASVKIEFTRSDSFIVAAPIDTIETMDNLLAVAGRIGQIGTWRHNDWMVVRSVFTTKELSVIGSSSKNRKIEFSGDGKSVSDFATFGFTAGVKRESAVRSAFDGRYVFSRYFAPKQHNRPTTLEELTRFNDVELFDLEADPLELENLAASRRSRDLVLAMNDKSNRVIEALQRSEQKSKRQ